MAPELRDALGEDLDALIRLHDRELDADALAALKAVDFPDSLALLPEDEAGKAAYANLGQALAGIAVPPSSPVLDELAADYAAIYLNNSFGASPYESVWLDDDHLACQQPMFELRELYAAGGWRVDDWRRRYDDHLVLQLSYLRRQMGRDDTDWEALARFIDEHIGFWLADFAKRVTDHCGTDFYAGLAQVTWAWLERFRDVLAQTCDLPRPDRKALTLRIRAKFARDKAEVAPIRFMPGTAGPSW